MTLVLALTARDGAVLVADGQATSGKGEMLTRTPVRKLGILHKRVGYGMAGSAGLRQRVVANLEERLAGEDLGSPISELRPRLHAAVNEVQHAAAGEHVRLGLASEAASIAVLFVGVSDDRTPWIYEVTEDGGEEVHQRAEAIGSGRAYARFALETADSYDLQGRGVGQVMLLGYRAVRDAIRTDAVALGEPISGLKATVEGACELDAEDLDKLKAVVSEWQQEECRLFDSLDGSRVES